MIGKILSADLNGEKMKRRFGLLFRKIVCTVLMEVVVVVGGGRGRGRTEGREEG